MRIGEASAASGVPERMIRHYEKLGLIPLATRRASGYRDYKDADVARLSFIARARSVGVSLDEVAELLSVEGALRVNLVERWLSILDGKAADVVMLREQLAGVAGDRLALLPHELDPADLEALRDGPAPENAPELDHLMD